MSALDSLIAELPEGTVVTDPAITEGYRQDRALDPAAGKPLAVVRPLTTEHVQTVMRWASAHRVPVVPRGAGSGLSGGATAIDDGIVLSIAQPKGMVESTRNAFKDIHERLGGIDVVLGFDCVLRRLDARNRQVFRDMSELYRANNVIGFGTYGEQYRSMHLNQTLTGIAFGRRQ